MIDISKHKRVDICAGLLSEARMIAEVLGLKDQPSKWSHTTHQTQVMGRKGGLLLIYDKTFMGHSIDRMVFSARMKGFTIKFVNAKGEEVEGRENIGTPRTGVSYRLA